jgi:hypothetical protein
MEKEVKKNNKRRKSADHGERSKKNIEEDERIEKLASRYPIY